MNIAEKFKNKIKEDDLFKMGLELKIEFIQNSLGTVNPLKTLTPKQIGGAFETQIEQDLKNKSELLAKIKNIYMNPFFEDGNFFNLETNPMLIEYKYIIFGLVPQVCLHIYAY